MFQLPKEVIEGIKSYGQSLEELAAGKISPARFKGVRVPWGIYSHRGGGVFMTRVRVPAGQVTADQLRVLAAAAGKYGHNLLHITTRQDIQIHNVKIEETLAMMDELKKCELSSRGGGGNTVRNVIACPRVGLCRNEVFDVRPLATAVTEYLLAQENSFTLPRKFKIAFSGCENDCTAVVANDVGFLAVEGGFKVWVGGGMGAKPRLGQLLAEFLPAEEVIYCIEAIKTVFFKHGDPKNRHQNRLRFLIAKLGLQELKKLYRQEFMTLKQNKQINLRKIEFPQRAEISGEAPVSDDQEYNNFLKYNVRDQRQKGWATVELRLRRGDILADELKKIADLQKEFSEIEFRTNQNQNLLIGWVKKTDLLTLYQKLKLILDRDFLFARTLQDVVACKGALTCNLGIGNSPALAAALEEMIGREFVGREAFRKLAIKINGCPNSCGHHPLGKISFYGLVKRVNNRAVPYYAVLIGGCRGAEKTRFAEEIGAIPGRSVPAFLKEFIRRAEPELDGDVDEFLAKRGKGLAREVLGGFTNMPSYEADRSYYTDWGREEDFSLLGVTQGECGAGVLDIIESDLKDAGKQLAAETFKALYQVLILSARALLVTKGADPKSDSEVLAQFKEKLVESGIVAYRFKNAADFAFSILKEEVKLAEARAYVQELFDEVSAAYKVMDSSFNFPVRSEIKKEAAGKKAREEKLADDEVLMDLRGVACPINYVKAKMKLENLSIGQKLLLYLDAGEPIKNVPASLKNDGQDVMSITEKENYFEVLVKKEV